MRARQILPSPERYSPRKCINLSFLTSGKSRPKSRRSYYIYESQISIVLCGSDKFHWTAYAFDETNVDEDNFGDRISEDEDMCMDPIPWSNDNEIYDAERPIWDPRLYFLTIFKSRIAQLQREWDELVSFADDSLEGEIQVCSLS